MGETKQSETKPMKMVWRSVAIALGIVCIILVAGIGGTIAYYIGVVNDKNSQIDTQNSQLNALNSTYQNYLSTRALITLIGGWLPLPSGNLTGILMSADKPRPWVSDIFSDYIPNDYGDPVLNVTLDQIEQTSTAYNITDTDLGTLWLAARTEQSNGPAGVWAKGSINIGKIFSNGTRSIVHSEDIPERFFGYISSPFDYNITISYLWTLSQPLTMNVGERLFLNVVLYGKYANYGSCRLGLICTQSDTDIMLVLPITPA
ncbi:MAG TPA: hypothetical protein VEH86_01970 [Candidatus Acidoferrum sp.]|nr:hypothetical protein [Candidatus Acidoferrum sp.]